MRTILFCFTAVLSGFVQAQLVRITLDNADNPNEPSVAIHPNGMGIVAASNIDNFYYRGVKEWKKTHSSSPLGVYGDPVLCYADTTLFFTHLSKTPGKAYGDWFDRIVVQKIKSIEPWSETSYSVGYNNGKMQDKPWLSYDAHSDKYSGSLYVTWTEFDKYGSELEEDKSRIRFAKYSPENDAFSDAITISDTTGDCRDGDNTLEGATTAVDADGNIYAVWSGHDYIWFDKSTDGGTTWHNDKKIATQPDGWDMDMPHIMRANGMPFIVCDTLNDILYVSWADEYLGNADVWLMYSKDKGETWSERIRVNQDTTNRAQYLPNMTINHGTGQVLIAYYDFRDSPSEAFYHVFINSFSIQNGISEYQITNNSIPLPGKNVFYGDYLDIDTRSNTLALGYTSNDFSNKTKVELAYSYLYNKYLYGQWKVGNAENVIGVLDENDSLLFQCNAVHPSKIKMKYEVRNTELGTQRKIRKKHTCTQINEPTDIRLAALKLDKDEHLFKTKIVIKDLETGKRRVIKSLRR